MAAPLVVSTGTWVRDDETVGSNPATPTSVMSQDIEMTWEPNLWWRVKPYWDLELDARAHDDGAVAGKPEVFGGVGGDA